MKNTILKTIGSAAFAIAMMMTFSQITVSAQDNADDIKIDDQQQEDVATRRQNARRLEGSWNHQGIRLNCQTGAVLGTFPAMFTFSRGGTFWEAGSQISPALRSPSHGIWSYESGRLYITSFQFFRFNADGTLAGRQIIRQQVQLSRDGNSYTASATAQVLDVNGNVIANNCAAGTGIRFQ
ncbi:MAG TPA: hypothetical protein VK468_01790 [Pyrinomonadaceae bacterium]|jgi:hypothetical protein|nr:hypothetical protein [Pyrinomonadaceae bacterium]